MSPRLKHICSLAVEWGVLAQSPTRGIRKLRVGRGRERYLTDEQRELLISSACPGLKLHVIGALYSGGRRRSLFGLEERDLDLDKMLVTFRATKNGEDHTVPLHPRFLEAVKPRLTGDPFHRVNEPLHRRDGDLDGLQETGAAPRAPGPTLPRSPARPRDAARSQQAVSACHA